ncbi:uncharacterized protein METZ01_LOCUS108815 [marine metagenome]|uniref:Uncharacterized protein n=1 Tax=marine metagenome TaxID=408172 RepID=A0A381WUK5_9ZZZZ
MKAEFLIILLVFSVVLTAVFLPLTKTYKNQSRRVISLIFAIALFSAFLFLNYTNVSNYNWNKGFEQQDIENVLMELDDHIVKNPLDLKALKLAGGAYLAMENYDKAYAYYQRAYQLTLDTDIEVIMGLIESGLMDQTGQLTEDPEILIKQAIQLEPDNPQALWFGGLIALGNQDNDLAIQRWSRLSENPEVSSQMQNSINSQLEQLKLMQSLFEE